MGWLEDVKKKLKSEETVSNEIVAQAHIENHALNLFHWADSEDRLQHHNKNVVKAFYSAGMLLEVCSTFGELNEEIGRQKTYAKWRAAHLHKCIKSGETPEAPAPKPDEQHLNESESEEYAINNPEPSGSQLNHDIGSRRETKNATLNVSEEQQEVPTYHQESPNKSLTAEQMAQAQKFCKYAASALTYEDVSTAIDNLEKALRLLKCVN